ncbi:hypothetical protein GCM10009789_03070 [Kribbella sancticallisti]|uniref:AAA+ ATPase domain-containing protein n=1 Tax=Kribbella sancticallisti TaxID=460087 RepID=A0ABN2C5M9_9ACTN
MSGMVLMRDAALLAAACHLAEPHNQVPAAEDGWRAKPEARAALRRKLQQHEGEADTVRQRLMDELGLSASGYWLVMLCAAVELYPEAAAAVSLLTEEARLQLPTPTVAARLLRGIRETPYRQALAAVLGGGQARALGLVELQDAPPGVPHSQQPIRLSAAELAALAHDAGGTAADTGGELDGFRAIVVPAQRITGFTEDVVGPARLLLKRRGLLVLRGISRRGARQLACDVATDQGRAAALITVTQQADQPVRLPAASELARAADRSGGALPVVDLYPLTAAHPGVLDALSRSARATSGLVVIVDESADTADLAVVDVPVIDHPAAKRIWSGLLPADQAEAMALRFRVGIEEASSAIREVEDLSDPADANLLATRVRAQGARRMGRYVSVVTSDARMTDLVVPDALAVQMQEIIAWQRTSHRVRWDMALGAGDPVGTGLTCLFAGKSGTGKTFAARCLANELGLNLYRIDLSQVVSKYIGETEKALAQIFDEVEAGHGLLLFDEADALFGRRSEVKDAHDRYANIEVGYLLQRLEAYEGVAVLTTNLQGNMDAAFVRRLRFIVHFPAPDRDLRRRLWDQSLPPQRWRDGDLPLDVMADRFQLSGGAIHNIGLAAAHLAAATPSGRITVAHLARATQRELLKAGRPADVGVLGQLAEASGLPVNGRAR